MIKFKSKIKKIFDNGTIKKIQKIIVDECYFIYKSNGSKNINTMWFFTKLSSIDGYDHNLYKIAKAELINTNKFSSYIEDNGSEYLTISDTLLKDMDSDILPNRAFAKKYRTEILASLSLIISICSLIVSIIALTKGTN